MRYELSLLAIDPGRGEFVRLARRRGRGPLPADVARRPKGMAAMMRFMESKPSNVRPCAAFLKASKLVIAQTANILFLSRPTPPDFVPKSDQTAMGASIATHDCRLGRRSARYASSDLREPLL